MFVGMLACLRAAGGSSLLVPITLTRRAQLSVNPMLQPHLLGFGSADEANLMTLGLRSTQSRRFGLVNAARLNRCVA